MGKTNSVGTPGYVAPEILQTDTYGPKVDIYSLGVILMEMFTKSTTKHERASNLIKLKERIVPSSVDDDFPDIAKLILSMTEPDPDVRISLDDCANLVEFTINDFVSPKHLQERILEQEKTI